MVEEDRVVCIRFGHDWDEQCMVMDETLYQVQAKVQNFAVIYLGELAFPPCVCVCEGLEEADEVGVVDITKVPDFNKVGFVFVEPGSG